MRPLCVRPRTEPAFERQLRLAWRLSLTGFRASKVCPAASKAGSKAKLNTLAAQPFGYAKRSKLNAMKACKPQHNGGTDNRPQTEDYLAALKKAVEDLPSSASECVG